MVLLGYTGKSDIDKEVSLTGGSDDLVAGESNGNPDRVGHLVRSRVVYSHCELCSSLDLFTLADVEKSAELLCRQIITQPLPEDIIQNNETVQELTQTFSLALLGRSSSISFVYNG